MDIHLRSETVFIQETKAILGSVQFEETEATTLITEVTLEERKRNFGLLNRLPPRALGLLTSLIVFLVLARVGV